MTQDDRMETITDPAEIRATDDPDPFRRNPVRRTGPDDPWRFTRFVADDHECVIVRDEYDEPAPFGSCSTHRRALSSPVALGCTTPAPVGAAVALDLDAIEARANAATEWNGPIGGPATDVARKDVPALVAYARRKSALAADSHARAEVAEAEVRRLTESRATVAANLSASLMLADAEVVTLRVKLAAVEALADRWQKYAATLDPMSVESAASIAAIATMKGAYEGCAEKIRAALATTGEGQ
jgi:hypothetical protein